MFIESSSFAASATAGLLTVKGGLALLVFATPFGWSGLIVGGLFVAGTAAVTSIGFNNYTKNNAGELYDKVMEKLIGL